MIGMVVSGPTIVFSDSFDRANSSSTMGSTDSAYGGTPALWVPNSGTWGIGSDEARLVSSTGQATTVIESHLADCIATLATPTAGNGGPCWRSTDDDNNWIIAIGGAIYKRVAGAFTHVADATGAGANGDIYRIVLAGNVHTVYLKAGGIGPFVQVAQFTDNFNATATKHGMRSDSDTAMRFDDFTIDIGAYAIRSVAHGLAVGDTVRFSPYMGPLPTGLTAGTIYYVIASTADAFKVSTTLGGSAVSITSEGAFFIVPLDAPVSHPAGSVCISEDVGTLAIDGVSLNTPAWGILDLSELWATLPALRGTNALLPESAGKSPYPRRIDQDVVVLLMDITGTCDQTGALYGNDEIGLETNLDYLLNNVVLPPAAPTATRSAVLTLPSGATRTADVQVSAFHQQQSKVRGLLRYALELTIPGGRFT